MTPPVIELLDPMFGLEEGLGQLKNSGQIHRDRRRGVCKKDLSRGSSLEVPENSSLLRAGSRDCRNICPFLDNLQAVQDTEYFLLVVKAYLLHFRQHATRPNLRDDIVFE